MGFIGVQPASAPLTSSDIADGIVTTSKLANSAVSTAKIADDAVGNTKLNLASDYAFTGTITGAGSNGLVRLGGANATGQNVGDVSFDLFTTSYDFYYVTYALSYASATNAWVRLRASSSYISASNYRQASVGIRSDGSARNIVHAGSTYFELGTSAEASNTHLSHAGSLLFHKPMVSSKTTQINMQCTVLDTSSNVIDKTGGGIYLATGSHNGFGIMGSVNLDEYNIQVFGVSQT